LSNTARPLSSITSISAAFTVNAKILYATKTALQKKARITLFAQRSIDG
jgi:hypothetical protein